MPKTVRFKRGSEVLKNVVRYMERYGVSTYALVFRDPDDNSMFISSGGDSIWRRGAVGVLGDIVDDDSRFGIKHGGSE